MKIYRFWARAEADRQPEGRDVAAFGCSNESVEAALADARNRANRIADTMRGGTEPKHYAYGERPVREEILEDFHFRNRETAVITRNSYGCRVLNTPRVFFADIDYERQPVSIGKWLASLFGKKLPDRDQQVVDRVRQVVAEDPRLGLRLYRTKNGFRCLASSRTFDPLSEESDRLLEKLQADSCYRQLCRVQECFRARISPKPWRCGLEKPPSRFPFLSDAQQEAYRSWEKHYEATAEAYATCVLIGDFGASHVDPEVEAVCKLHDLYACPHDGPLS